MVWFSLMDIPPPYCPRAAGRSDGILPWVPLEGNRDYAKYNQ